MDEEIVALKKNDTWSNIIPFIKGWKLIGCKWVLQINVVSHRGTKKYKERLVVRGYFQVEGVDYNEIFSPIAKIMSIRFFISIVVAYDL